MIQLFQGHPSRRAGACQNQGLGGAGRDDGDAAAVGDQHGPRDMDTAGDVQTRAIPGL